MWSGSFVTKTFAVYDGLKNVCLFLKISFRRGLAAIVKPILKLLIPTCHTTTVPTQQQPLNVVFWHIVFNIFKIGFTITAKLLRKETFK